MSNHEDQVLARWSKDQLLFEVRRLTTECDDAIAKMKDEKLKRGVVTLNRDFLAKQVEKMYADKKRLRELLEEMLACDVEAACACIEEGHFINEGRQAAMREVLAVMKEVMGG